MAFHLEQTEIDAFNRDGVVPLRQLINQADLERLAAAIEDDIREPGPFYHGYESDEGRFHGNLRLWETHQTFREICLNSELPGLAQSFFGSRKINLL